MLNDEKLKEEQDNLGSWPEWGMSWNMRGCRRKEPSTLSRWNKRLRRVVNLKTVLSLAPPSLTTPNFLWFPSCGTGRIVPREHAPQEKPQKLPVYRQTKRKCRGKRRRRRSLERDAEARERVRSRIRFVCGPECAAARFRFSLEAPRMISIVRKPRRARPEDTLMDGTAKKVEEEEGGKRFVAWQSVSVQG